MVDRKYYLSDRAKIGIVRSSYICRNKLIQKSNICSTLCARDYKEPKCIIENGGGIKPNMTDAELKQLAIRKLTPKECWRLMGFDDEDFDKAREIPTSDAQLYKQAGNSIVVDVLEAIFNNLI